MPPHNPLVLDVKSCARCEQDHQAVPFTAFTRAPDCHTHYAACPETDEPILMHIETVMGPPVPITINGLSHQADKLVLTYDDVVHLAGQQGQPDVTWRHGGQAKSLKAGEEILLRPGMVFNANHTGSA